jgi:2-dehydro-3-deoxyphosphogluconate aldolase / (4S)-4-hydroxy-2-oxoglutarate aldolase
MTRAEVVANLKDIGVVPVVRAGAAAEALQLTDAIRAGGLPVVEITMTVPGALQVIEHLSRVHGAALWVGAGSVLDAETAQACIDAGARFVVSPTLDIGTLQRCGEQDVAVMAGALTPTEVVKAWAAGADFVKVFPASALGGAAYIRSLKAPLPHVELVPTGGVTLANAADFIAAGAAAIGVGSDLANVDAIRRGQPEEISAAARAYLDIVRAARRRKAAP